MIWLLNIFSAHREAIAQVQELQSDNEKLQDRCAQLEARLAGAEDRERIAREDSLKARERMADWLALGQGFPSIFDPEAKRPEPKREAKVVDLGIRHPRERVVKAEQQFDADLKDWLAQQGTVAQ